VRYLCRALGQDARQRQFVCRAFPCSARQNIFFRKLNFALIFISPLKKYYFVLNISILYVY
jgi:hypothetical protein